MARKRSSDSGGASSEWLNTYADMVTLLLTFFILLFSMSSLDAAKFNLFVTAASSGGTSPDKIIISLDPTARNVEGGNNEWEGEITLEVVDLQAIAKAIQDFIEQNNAQNSVEVSHGEGYVFIQFMEDMLFQPNSARLKDPNMEILNFVGQAIKSVQNDVELISVNGHTAAIPGNPDYAVSDRDLSSARANVILRYFEDNVGVDSSKLVQVAWGKWRPYDSNETEAGRAKNRRVEILISADNPIADQLDNVYEQLREG